MTRAVRHLILTGLVLGAFALSADLTPQAEAQTKGTAPAKKAAKAGKAHPTVAHRFRVSIRHPRPVTFRLANSSAASAKAAQMRAQGWRTRIKKESSGFTVIAKMPRWRLKAIANSKATAAGMANVLRSQGFQVRTQPIQG